MKPENKNAIIEHAKREYPRESCGLIVEINNEEIYKPCKNIAENQRDFILDPSDFADAEDSGRILAVVHSHCDIAPKPSQADLAGCEASNLPWLIIGVPMETWETIYPSGYKAPLIGREFSHGVHDCFSLVRDWYKEEMNIEIMDFERNQEWWKKGENLYLDNFQKAGFEIVEGSLKRGDIIIMQVASPVPNHAAVYLDRDVMIHHLQNRLSGRDVYGGYWKKITRCVVRHKGAQ